MRILERKFIAPYLPYNLTAYGASDIWVVSGLIGRKIVISNSIHTQSLDLDDFSCDYSLILHPLDEIDTTVMADDLGGSMSDAIMDWIEFFDGDGANRDNAILAAPYPVAEWCFQNRFDFYSLIPEWLAVDINTFNK